jgi:hypothetical protein
MVQRPFNKCLHSSQQLHTVPSALNPPSSKSSTTDYLLTTSPTRSFCATNSASSTICAASEICNKCIAAALTLDNPGLIKPPTQKASVSSGGCPDREKKNRCSYAVWGVGCGVKVVGCRV